MSAWARYRSVQDDLRRRGILSKRWTSSTGRTWGGVKFSRGALYWLLRNPVYVGQVAHKGQIYEGRQQAIVDRALWEQAQELLSAKSAARERRPIAPGGRPLAGRLFDDRGNAMSPSYTIQRNGQRYPYYVSQALLQNEKGRAGSIARVPAEEIERLVQKALGPRSDEARVHLKRRCVSGSSACRAHRPCRDRQGERPMTPWRR